MHNTQHAAHVTSIRRETTDAAGFRIILALLISVVLVCAPLTSSPVVGLVDTEHRQRLWQTLWQTKVNLHQRMPPERFQQSDWPLVACIDLPGSLDATVRCDAWYRSRTQQPWLETRSAPRLLTVPTCIRRCCGCHRRVPLKSCLHSEFMHCATLLPEQSEHLILLAAGRRGRVSSEL